MCCCVPLPDCVCNGGCEVGLQFLRNPTVGRYVKQMFAKKSFLIHVKQRHLEEETINFTFLIA